MEEFIDKMVEHVPGLSKETAHKILAFLTEHKEDALKAIEKSSLKDKLPGGLGDKLGSLF
ncbi:MAG: hypothetical protein QM831_01095 [Kofleriaceae bacterium]